MIFKININTPEAAQELNRIASKYPFDIQVKSRNGQADAKSLLGTMLLTIERDLTLITEDGADTRLLELDLKPYIEKFV